MNERRTLPPSWVFRFLEVEFDVVDVKPIDRSVLSSLERWLKHASECRREPCTGHVDE